MKKLWDAIWDGEPAVGMGVFAAIVNLLVWGFLPDWSGAVATALSVIGGLVVRQQVYPQKSVEEIKAAK